MKSNEYEKERFLWLSVIRLAQSDAEGLGFVSSVLRNLAIRWLTARSQSFDDVCSFAGLTTEQTKLLQDISREKWLIHSKIN